MENKLACLSFYSSRMLDSQKWINSLIFGFVLTNSLQPQPFSECSCSISAPRCSINQRNKTPINLLATALYHNRIGMSKTLHIFFQTSSRNVKLCKWTTFKKKVWYSGFYAAVAVGNVINLKCFSGVFFCPCQRPITTKSVNHSSGLCCSRRMNQMSVNFDTANDLLIL